MRMRDDVVVARDADFFLVLVSPRLVWRVGLPGAPDCCHEHACQIRQLRGPWATVAIDRGAGEG